MSAGFSAIDVHMTDIISGRVSIASFVGLAASDSSLMVVKAG